MNGPIIAYRGNMGVQTSAPFANTKSLSFDGVDDYLNLGDSDDFSFGDGVTDSPFSISGWIKMNDSTKFRLFSKYTTGAIEYIFTTDSYDKLSFVLYDNSSLARIQRKYNTALTSYEGQWINIIGTYDGSSSSYGIKIYLNGVRVDDIDGSTGAYTAMENTTQPVQIGRLTTSYSNGLMDEVCLLDRVATPSEIVTLSTAPTVDLTDLNPLAWYRNGDNGSWKSPQWLIPNNENKDKVSNYSFDFDGVDDIIDCGSSSYLLNTTQFSFSLWAKQTTATSTKGIFGDWAYNSRGNFILQTLTVSGNSTKLQFGIRESSGFKLVDTDNYVFTENTWNHIAIIFNAGSLNIYVNGVNESFTGDVLPTSLVNSLGILVIGQFAGLGRYFNGLIDDVAIFDSAISIGDVWDGSGQPIDVSLVSGIVSYYKMGEDSTFLTNWTVPDNVGSNDGTSANMTIEDRIGEAPNSSNNALSLNMDEVDRVTDVPT
tara:strand:+ start:1552 stop:3003 length:1452 start_codon:yes stop_codon:yes gene_type:complete